MTPDIETCTFNLFILRVERNIDYNVDVPFHIVIFLIFVIIPFYKKWRVIVMVSSYIIYILDICGISTVILKNAIRF